LRPPAFTLKKHYFTQTYQGVAKSAAMAVTDGKLHGLATTLLLSYNMHTYAWQASEKRPRAAIDNCMIHVTKV
jgi:hypothetical protein